MALNDEELLQEFTRVRDVDAEVLLEVRLINWMAGPHSPETSWVEVERLASGESTEVIGRHRHRLLQRRRYFRICASCSERKPVGWMHDSQVCQGCAERTLGVVYLSAKHYVARGAGFDHGGAAQLVTNIVQARVRSLGRSGIRLDKGVAGGVVS